MAWGIEETNGCAIVRMNTNKVNVQNDSFFADLHEAFDRLAAGEVIRTMCVA